MLYLCRYKHYFCIWFEGASGDMFTNLAEGSYTIKIRYTPTGSSQSFMFSDPLMFSIASK